MLTSLKIEGFRLFDEFNMSDLGRINLLVGKNNSGKTSVLEAIDLLMTRGDPHSLFQNLVRRGELAFKKSEVPDKLGVDVSHLFHGHRMGIGSKIDISNKSENGTAELAISVVESFDLLGRAASRNNVAKSYSRFALNITGKPDPIIEDLGLSQGSIIYRSNLEEEFPLLKNYPEEDRIGHRYVSTESLKTTELAAIWDELVTDPKLSEERIIRSLQILDPSINKIIMLSILSDQSRGGFIVGRNGVMNDRIPIGSLGEGMWRMLALAMAITQCKGGTLLVDEIDTGLHYSAMYDMWRMIYKTAIELDVQVFATTHSLDCINSLAELCRKNLVPGEHVALKRIDAGKKQAVNYDEDMIKAAASSHIETR